MLRFKGEALNFFIKLFVVVFGEVVEAGFKLTVGLLAPIKADSVFRSL